MKQLFAGVVTGLLVLGGAGSVTAAFVDFESTPSSAITGGSWTATSGYSSYGFEDKFQWSFDWVQLDLSGLALHTTIDLEFDLAIIDSWDGSAPSNFSGPDYFNIEVDGTEVFEEAFSNINPAYQSYTGTSIVSNVSIFKNSYNDSAYHITLSGLSHSTSTLTIKWFADGDGWQGPTLNGWDESFAVDNIRIDTQAPIPEPATMLLFGTGLVGLVGCRLRKVIHS